MANEKTPSPVMGRRTQLDFIWEPYSPRVASQGTHEIYGF